MEQKYLGDSYDLVKRFWAENLSSVAPIYADETFIPEEIREEYIHITGIPIFYYSVARPFAIFLDPCTGIPSPRNTAHKPPPKYASLSFISEVIEELHPKFLVCFDQSYSRGSEKKPLMEEKMNALFAKGLCSFYYTSHANFLFVSKSAAVTSLIRKQLLDIGIPRWRLKPTE